MICHQTCRPGQSSRKARHELTSFVCMSSCGRIARCVSMSLSERLGKVGMVPSHLPRTSPSGWSGCTHAELPLLLQFVRYMRACADSGNQADSSAGNSIQSVETLEQNGPLHHHIMMAAACRPHQRELQARMQG